MLWLNVFGTPKNPGGVSELLGPRRGIPMLYYAKCSINKPLFMHCGACRAIPEVNMLWLDAIGTPKNPGGVSELSGPRREFLCYTMRCGE